MTARKAGADEFGASDFESEDDFDVGDEETTERRSPVAPWAMTITNDHGEETLDPFEEEVARQVQEQLQAGVVEASHDNTHQLEPGIITTLGPRESPWGILTEAAAAILGRSGSQADREEVDERTYDALLESQVRRERAAREFQEAQRLAMQEHFIRASHRHNLGTGAMIDQESITWAPERQVLASLPPSKPKPVVPVVTEAPPRRFS